MPSSTRNVFALIGIKLSNVLTSVMPSDLCPYKHIGFYSSLAETVLIRFILAGVVVLYFSLMLTSWPLGNSFLRKHYSVLNQGRGSNWSKHILFPILLLEPSSISVGNLYVSHSSFEMKQN